MNNKFQLFINDKKLFGSYFAGLWEGGGHIIIPKINKEGKCVNTPGLFITFKNVNYPLVERIVSHLGGWIREKKKEGALVLSITKREELNNCMLLMNGYLRSPKIFEFRKLLSYVNKSHTVKDVDSLPLDGNAWLSGFIDTDGGGV